VDWVTLNRPEALNALNMKLVDELLDYFGRLYQNHSVRVVVLKSAGRVFCAGLDLSGPESGSQDPTIQLTFSVQRKIADIIKAMRRCPQPIISLVQGAACGGGFSLVLGSDVRIAAQDCKMNAAYIKIGLTGCDIGSSYLLPRLVGTSIASELILTERFIHAQRALAVGLVSDVVPFENLEPTAQTFIDEMLLTAPMALRLTKETLNFSIDPPSLESAMAFEDRHQVMLSRTDDHVEAVRAFTEKRAPNFTDR